MPRPPLPPYMWKARLGGVLYATALLAPLLIMFVPPYPAPTTFWREFSVALGFAGMAMMAMQFIPTARLPLFRDVYPSDTLYKHHRQVAMAGFLLAIAHPIILFISTPSMLSLLNPVTAPWRARAAVAGVICLLIVMVTSIWRTALKIPYHVWRWLHVVLTASLAALFLFHMLGVNRYMAHPLMRAYWFTMMAIWALAVLYARVWRPMRIRHVPYRVVEVRPERGNTYTLALEPDGHTAHHFLAGQFAWIAVDKSPFTLRDNPFSFSSSAAQTDRVEFAIGAVGDFTKTVPELTPGTRVFLDGPFGTFDLEQHRGRGYVFLAGGSGIVPIMSILRTMADRHDQTPAILFHATQTREDATFAEEIDLLADHLNLTVIPVVANPAEGYVGETGFVDADMLDRHLPADRAQRQYFVCGPPPMIDAVVAATTKLGVPRDHLHSEHYLMA